MTTKTVQFTNPTIRGELTVPGDKSISHRAIMLASIAQGTTKITGFLDGEDCLRTIKMFEQMGVEIKQSGTDVLVTSPGMKNWTQPNEPLYAGNSGTTARLMLGILSGSSIEAIITGDESLSQRPMGRVAVPLRQMGARLVSETGDDRLPMRVSGHPLTGIHYENPVASAQVKSSILFGGLQANGQTTVVEETVSRDHTEQMLRYFGAKMVSENGQAIIEGGNHLQAKPIAVPADISSAAFFMVAAALLPKSEIHLPKVGLNPTRTGIIDVMRAMGVGISLSDVAEREGERSGTITVSYASIQPTIIEGAVIPRLIDEIPILALLATQATGTTIIRDAAELRVKETDRIEAVTTELRKLGAQIEPTEDGMIITGPTPLKGHVELDSYGDHRLGMMAAIAALIADGPISILDAPCINISYPTFFQHLEAVVR